MSWSELVEGKYVVLQSLKGQTRHRFKTGGNCIERLLCFRRHCSRHLDGMG